mmetsp:Transcript_161147/g.517251  ORF Transcript_161147/g.517251 Transcript_161147/m.517251 type:complete len:285 (+) Transcript_161147:1583-2437(+)
MQEFHELLAKGTIFADDEHRHAVAGLEDDVRNALHLILHRSLDVDLLLGRAEGRGAGLVEDRLATARLQERRHLEEGCAVSFLQELLLGIAPDGTAESDDRKIFSEDTRPRHDEQPLLEENLAREAILEIAALKRQGPGPGVRASAFQRAILADVLAEDDLLAEHELRRFVPLRGHDAHHAIRGRVLRRAHDLDGMGRELLLQGFCHVRGQAAELLVRVDEGLVRLLVDDQGVHLVQDEDPVSVAVEVALLAARDARVEGLHMLRLAIADVGLGVDTRRQAAGL